MSDLLSRCVGGFLRPAFMFSGDPQVASSHFPLSLGVSSPSSPFHQWYPSSVAPRDVGTDLLLLKTCVFQLLWPLFCLVLSRKGAVLGHSG